MMEIVLNYIFQGQYKMAFKDVSETEINIVKKEDPFVFEGHLYYGPLDGGYNGKERCQMVKMLFYHIHDEKKLKQYNDCKIDISSDIISRLKKGEDVRVWYDIENYPNQICDLYFLVDFLQKYTGDIYLQEFPSLPGGEIETEEGMAVGVLNYTPIIHAYLNPIKADDIFLKFCSAEWKRLVKENGNLRIYKEQKIVSVEEDFYDEYLLRVSNGKEIDFKKVDKKIFTEVSANYIIDRCILLGIYHPDYLNTL